MSLAKKPLVSVGVDGQSGWMEWMDGWLEQMDGVDGQSRRTEWLEQTDGADGRSG